MHPPGSKIYKTFTILPIVESALLSLTQDQCGDTLHSNVSNVILLGFCAFIALQFVVFFQVSSCVILWHRHKSYTLFAYDLISFKITSKQLMTICFEGVALHLLLHTFDFCHSALFLKHFFITLLLLLPQHPGNLCKMHAQRLKSSLKVKLKHLNHSWGGSAWFDMQHSFQWAEISQSWLFNCGKP